MFYTISDIKDVYPKLCPFSELHEYIFGIRIYTLVLEPVQLKEIKKKYQNDITSFII